MSDEREYIMAFTMQEDGRFALEFDTLGKSAVREEIIRCCDCKYAKTTLQGMPAERVLVCTAHLRDFPTSDDGFCHLGRRRYA